MLKLFVIISNLCDVHYDDPFSSGQSAESPEYVDLPFSSSLPVVLTHSLQRSGNIGLQPEHFVGRIG